MTTRTLHPDTRQEIEDELAYSRQAQSWSFGSTRTLWVDELAAILDADDEGGNVDAAMSAARAEAQRLATIIAEGLVDDVRSLHADALSAGIDEDTLPDPDTATVAEMIAAVQATGITVDSGSWGARDGWSVTAESAWVAASVRDWEIDRVETVTVDVPR